jgi:hypothetical protein
MNQRNNFIISFFSMMVIGIMLISINAYALTPAKFVSNAEGGIIITPASNGIIVANIPQIYPFNFTLNGSYFKPYISYISATSAGLSVNGSLISLALNQAALVRTTSNYTFYAKIVNISYYAKPQTVDIYFYSVPIPASATQSTSKTSSTIVSTTTIPPTTTITATSSIVTVVPPILNPQFDLEDAALVILIVVVIVGTLYYVIRMSQQKTNKKK